jgi:hypothetical protein
MAWSDWAGIATTGVLGAAGLYFANSVRRRTQADLDHAVTEKRFAAYGAMWTELEQAAAMSRGADVDRDALFDALTRWYYDGGNGMLLTQDARSLYLTAKNNLVCPADEFLPARTRADVARSEAERLRHVVRQFSLLRTAMRADIRLYTTPWGSALTDDDVAFLLACGVDIGQEPWRRSLPGRWSADERARLAELGDDPPAWLSDSLGPPPEAGDALELWRRSALTADEIQRRAPWSP